MDIKAYYEAEEIKSVAKRSLAHSVTMLCIYIALVALSIFAIIFFGEKPVIFLESVVLIIISACLLSGILRRWHLYDYTEACGEIKKVHREVTSARNIYSSNVNLFGIRRYDKYVKRGIRLTVFISNDEDVLSYQINGADTRQEKYYEAGGEVLHLWGTHYPVKAPTGEEWMCPICGEFNQKNTKICKKCRQKILK